MIIQLTRECEWHDWFAWYPVRLYGNKIAWLTTVSRWHSRTARHPWQYKELDDSC